MRIVKKASRKSAVKAATRKNLRRRSVKAAEELEDEVIDEEFEEGGGEGAVDVDETASDLLFEAEDVAELVAEVTGQDVAVTAEDDVVTFEVGEDEFVVEAEGDEEILENTRKPLKNKSRVRASKKVAPRARSRRRARR